MGVYITRVLVPYLQQRAQGAPALLLLDSFSAHWTAQTTARLEELGITPYKIPPGCTCLAQPIDVGLSKPMKDRVRSRWWDWMIQQGPEQATFVGASRELGTKWVVEAWESIPEAIVRNSWRKDGYSYFLEE